MIDFLYDLALKLIMATLSLTLVWVVLNLSTRLIKRPSVQLQAWSSWIPLWQTLLLGSITIPVAVVSPEQVDGFRSATAIGTVRTGSVRATDDLNTDTTLPEPPSDYTRESMSDSAAPTPIAPLPVDSSNLIRWAFSTIALVWLFGWLIVLSRWLLGYWQLLRYVRSCEEASPSMLMQWHQLLDEHEIRHEIPVLTSDFLGPALCRLPQGYVLLLPTDFSQRLSQDSQQAVMRHELAHYRRGHLWKMMCARTLAALHWINPCAWWSVVKLETAYESMADEDAVGEDTQAACNLARTLLDLCPRLGANSSILAAQGSNVKLRIARLIDHTHTQESIMVRYFCVGVGCCLTMCSLIRLEYVSAQDNTASPRVNAANPEAKRTAANLNPQAFNYRFLLQAVPIQYELAPGDRVHLIYEQEKVDRELTLPADGTVNVPGIGTVQLTQLTLDKARESLNKLADPNPVVLTLLETRKVNVAVTRSSDTIKNPNGAGKYRSQTVRLPAYQNDVLHALIETGGLPKSPAWRLCVVHRPVGSRLRIVSVDYHSRQVDPNDMILNEGDEVVVHSISQRRDELIDLRGLGNFLLVVANGRWDGDIFPVTELMKLQDNLQVDKLPFKSLLQFSFLTTGKLGHSQRYFDVDGELTYKFTMHPKLLLPAIEEMADELGIQPLYLEIVAGIATDPTGPQVDLPEICNTVLDNRCQLIVENRAPKHEKTQQFAVIVRIRESELDKILERLARIESTSSNDKIKGTQVHTLHGYSFCVHQDQLLVGTDDLIKKIIEH